MPPTVVVIANPAAGGLRRVARLERFAALLRERGAGVDLRWTRDAGVPGNNLDLTRGADLLVAAGGDGTLHQAANILFARRERTPLAFFPAGTANVFAHQAALPRGDAELADLILRTAPAEYRLGWGRFTGLGGGTVERVFLLMAGAGWDARVTMAVNRGVKRLHGKGAYVLSSLGVLARGAGEPVRVVADGREAAGEAVIVGVSPLYAGPYRVIPGADPSAPRFTLAVVRRASAGGLLRILWHARRGRPDPSGNVLYLEAATVEMPDRGLPLQLDGDPAGWTPALFRKGDFTLPVIGGRAGGVKELSRAQGPNPPDDTHG